MTDKTSYLKRQPFWEEVAGRILRELEEIRSMEISITPEDHCHVSRQGARQDKWLSTGRATLTTGTAIRVDAWSISIIKCDNYHMSTDKCSPWFDALAIELDRVASSRSVDEMPSSHMPLDKDTTQQEPASLNGRADARCKVASRPAGGLSAVQAIIPTGVVPPSR